MRRRGLLAHPRMSWGIGISFPITINFDGDGVKFFTGGWSEAGGNVLNDQIVLGTEKVTNGGFGADTDWNKGVNWTIVGGVLVATGVNNTNTNQNVGLVAQQWNRITGVISGFVSGFLDIEFGGSNPLLPKPLADGAFIRSGRRDGSAVLFLIGNPISTYDVDDISVKQFTLISLINALKSQFGLSDGFFIDVAINAVTAGNQVGVIWNLDDTVTPTNFGMAYMDGVNLVVEKNVAGTYTELASVAQVVTPDQILRIENLAGTNVLSIKYNGVEKATPTIADASVIENKGIALFSTEANNAISKVVIGKL